MAPVSDVSATPLPANLPPIRTQPAGGVLPPTAPSPPFDRPVRRKLAAMARLVIPRPAEPALPAPTRLTPRSQRRPRQPCPKPEPAAPDEARASAGERAARAEAKTEPLRAVGEPVASVVAAGCGVVLRAASEPPSKLNKPLPGGAMGSAARRSA